MLGVKQRRRRLRADAARVKSLLVGLLAVDLGCASTGVPDARPHRKQSPWSSPSRQGATGSQVEPQAAESHEVVELAGIDRDGSPVESTQWLGKVVVLAFTSFDRPLEAEIRRHLLQWGQRWSRAQVEVVSVQHDPRATKWLPAAEVTGLIDVLDPQGAWALRLNIDRLPLIAVMNRQGRLVWRQALSAEQMDVAMSLAQDKIADLVANVDP